MLHAGKVRSRAAAALTLGLAVASLALAPAASAGSACSDTSKTTLKLQATKQYEETWRKEFTRGGAPERKVLASSSKDLGTTSVVVVGCKDAKTKTWKALHIDVTPSYKGGTYVFKDGVPQPEGSFFLPTSVTSDRVNGRGYRCTMEWNSRADAARSGLKKALGFPIPMPTAVSIGAFLVEKVIPEGKKYSQCGKTDEMQFGVTFSSTGAARWTSATKAGKRTSAVETGLLNVDQKGEWRTYLSLTHRWVVKGL